MFSKILVASAAAAVAVVAITATTIAAQVPPDLPCVTWEKSSSFVNTPPVSSLFVSGIGWVIGAAGDCTVCLQQGDLIPCFSASTSAGVENTWGHHDYLQFQIPSDYCRIWTQGQVYMANNFYLPKKGPKWETWKFVLSQTGSAIPANAIRVGSKVMASSTSNAPGCCAGQNFVGFAEAVPGPNGGEVFGAVHFSIQQQAVTTHTFNVAVCKAYHPTTIPTTAAPPTPAPPPNTKPYIRFAHTIPTSNKVTATITQGSVSKTWSCYDFGQFSNWDQQFEEGNGQVQITECDSSTVIFNQSFYLPPGPLVVATKGYWPMNIFSVEAIAASYAPAAPSKSGVRLFNLMPDVASAGMTLSGKPLVDKIRFTLGSKWMPIEAEEQFQYAAFDDSTSKTLATLTSSAPVSPFVFTAWLVGLANSTAGGVFAPRLIALIDAPEL